MSKYSENKPADLKEAIGWMFDYIDDDKIFMDFGCSTGYFGALIKKAKNNKVYGVEISKDIDEARKVLDGVYSFDLDAEWPEKVYERKYDYLFFGDVIEHLKDPKTVLKKCKRLLNMNGLIFISTPNIAHISIRLELMNGNFDYEPMGILDETHLKYFTKSSLIKLIDDAGYSLKTIDFTANDYPDTVIKKLLAKEGLKPTEKFWRIVNSPEARAFQYKIIIGLDKTNIVSKKNSGPPKPEQVRNAEVNGLQEQAKKLLEHAEKQAEIIEHYKVENEDLNKKLKRIESSKVYKAALQTRRIIKRKPHNKKSSEHPRV